VSARGGLAHAAKRQWVGLRLKPPQRGARLRLAADNRHSEAYIVRRIRPITYSAGGQQFPAQLWSGGNRPGWEAIAFSRASRRNRL